MKRIFMLIALSLVTSAIWAQGGDYTPRLAWPFVYEHFQEGAARTRDGALITEALFNVAVHDGSLMYVGEDNIVMKPDMSRVYSARVGKDDVYINIMGRMYRLLSELDCGYVLVATEIDQTKMEKVNIGYGISSATASTQGVTNLLDGNFETNIRTVLKSRETDRYRSEPLPVRQVYYLYDGLHLIQASKQELVNTPGIDKKTANAFIKREKIKWKDTASLEKVLIFIDSQLN